MDRFDLEYGIMSLLSTVEALDLIAGTTSDVNTKTMVEGVARLLELKHDKIYNSYIKVFGLKST